MNDVRLIDRFGEKSVNLKCFKCTRQESVQGTMEDATAKGWVVEQREEGDRFICPKCPAFRPNFTVRIGGRDVPAELRVVIES